MEEEMSSSIVAIDGGKNATTDVAFDGGRSATVAFVDEFEQIFYFSKPHG